MADLLKIGVSACLWKGEPQKKLFNGRKLLYWEESLAHFILRNGALAFLIPTPSLMPSAATLKELTFHLDGLVLHGGIDISPLSYGEVPIKEEWQGDKERDDYDFALLDCFLEQKKPILGICRGMQLINVAMGGSLYQDIIHLGASTRIHRDAALYEKNEHDIEFLSDSYLSKLYPGQQTARVNSVHHQAVKVLGQGLVVEAQSKDDGIVEAIRLRSHMVETYCFGVQWHPEFQTMDHNHLLPPDPILQDFLQAAKCRKALD